MLGLIWTTTQIGPQPLPAWFFHQNAVFLKRLLRSFRGLIAQLTRIFSAKLLRYRQALNMWMLNGSVKLPTGGELLVLYQGDDFFTQGKEPEPLKNSVQFSSILLANHSNSRLLLLWLAGYRRRQSSYEYKIRAQPMRYFVHNTSASLSFKETSSVTCGIP